LLSTLAPFFTGSILFLNGNGTFAFADGLDGEAGSASGECSAGLGGVASSSSPSSGEDVVALFLGRERSGDLDACRFVGVWIMDRVGIGERQTRCLRQTERNLYPKESYKIKK
jgi:hypothetical protein